jgi:hypothetical protein
MCVGTRFNALFFTRNVLTLNYKKLYKVKFYEVLFNKFYK